MSSTFRLIADSIYQTIMQDPGILHGSSAWSRLSVRSRGDFLLVGKNGFLIGQNGFLVSENFFQGGLVLQDSRLVVEQRFLIFQNSSLVAEDGFLIGYNFVI
jgi:hypothetical protein